MSDAGTTSSEEKTRIAGTLQAVLQHADGTMGSMAVPLPLPEAIVTVEERRSAADFGPAASSGERWFWRARSPDSVLRYAERAADDPPGAAGGCAACGGRRSVYFVPKHDAAPPWPRVYCGECYTTQPPKTTTGGEA